MINLMFWNNNYLSKKVKKNAILLNEQEFVSTNLLTIPNEQMEIVQHFSGEIICYWLPAIIKPVSVCIGRVETIFF